MIQFQENAQTDGRKDGRTKGRTDPILQDPAGYHQRPQKNDVSFSENSAYVLNE